MARRLIIGEEEIRRTRVTMDAIVLPADAEPLFGAAPMENMDVMVHPGRQELDVHPDHPEGLWMMKRMRHPSESDY